jgi:hypothetical protein
MPDLEYEILHENVYYFPGAVQNIDSVVKAIEDVNSLAITPWEIWYANNDAKENPYGDLKVMTWKNLELESDMSTRDTAKYALDGLVGALEACGELYMRAHGADDADISALHDDLYVEEQVFGIRRYDEGGDMGPHSDRVVEGKDTYTIAAYLDSDYEGGELVVQAPEGSIEISLGAGSIVVFPSKYLHESKKLLSGRKTMLTHVHTALRNILPE